MGGYRLFLVIPGMLYSVIILVGRFGVRLSSLANAVLGLLIEVVILVLCCWFNFSLLRRRTQQTHPPVQDSDQSPEHVLPVLKHRDPRLYALVVSMLGVCASMLLFVSFIQPGLDQSSDFVNQSLGNEATQLVTSTYSCVMLLESLAQVMILWRLYSNPRHADAIIVSDNRAYIFVGIMVCHNLSWWAVNVDFELTVRCLISSDFAKYLTEGLWPLVVEARMLACTLFAGVLLSKPR